MQHGKPRCSHLVPCPILRRPWMRREVKKPSQGGQGPHGIWGGCPYVCRQSDSNNHQRAGNCNGLGLDGAVAHAPASKRCLFSASLRSRLRSFIRPCPVGILRLPASRRSFSGCLTRPCPVGPSRLPDKRRSWSGFFTLPCPVGPARRRSRSSCLPTSCPHHRQNHSG